jgi:hypothetical protein
MTAHRSPPGLDIGTHPSMTYPLVVPPEQPFPCAMSHSQLDQPITQIPTGGVHVDHAP